DSTDFRLPEIHLEELKQGLRNSVSVRPEQNIPDMYYSLRVSSCWRYFRSSVLHFLILLPNVLVFTKIALCCFSLTGVRQKEKVKVTFGLNPKKKEHYGIMMYHKNRLIKAYEKVGCQLKASGQRVGIGVIGIIECNFLKPAHNKQDFEYTKEYRYIKSKSSVLDP
ncbi:hypothetical protein XENOCAPTIV_005801, partial [Xenoophorus captivus]